jgi:hypothetical protein
VSPAVAAPPAPAQTIDDLAAGAIQALRGQLVVLSQVVSSHLVSSVHGLEQPAAIDAFATYALIAGIGQGIRVNLAIATEMLGGGPVFGGQLQRDVDRIIGTSNAISDDFRENRRNPWFTECLGHALLNISRDVVDLGPPGRIEALTLVHTDVSDHGLDLVGLHLEQALLGLNVAEAKASENHASNHGSATATLFAEIDAGTRDAEIRAKVQLLREALSQERQTLVTPSFWHGRRAYLAVISYGATSSFAPTHARPAYGSLTVGAARVRLVAVPLSNYRKFFDDVADRVRALVPVVAALGRGV